MGHGLPELGLAVGMEAIGFDPAEFIGRFDVGDDESHDSDTPCRDAGPAKPGSRIRRVDRQRATKP